MRKQPISFLSRSGGEAGNRTPDLLHAMQALSRLSYIPLVVDRTGL